MLLFLLACDLFSPPETLSPARVESDPVAAMRTRPLELTRHARCRMGCRYIDLAEVKAVLATGAYQPERTREDGRCPTHALEGPDSEGGPLRVVFAACADETRVVTVIDLDDDHPCECD